MTHRSYEAAHAAALALARDLDRPVGLAKAGRGYSVRPLPLLPSNRFGWETRCEVVEPGDPASESDLRIWADGAGPLAGYARKVLAALEQGVAQ